MKPLGTLRGSGPPPLGYYRCFDPECPARRDPFSGRFGKPGNHYHRINDRDNSTNGKD